MIDLNASWQVQTLLEFNSFIQQPQHQVLIAKLLYLEQPFPLVISPEEHKQWALAKNQGPVKLMCDESFADHRQLQLAAELSHAVNIKVEKAGGAINAVRSALMAKDMGLEVMLGSMMVSRLGCNMTYALHPLVSWLDVDGELFVGHPDLPGGFNWLPNGQLGKP